MESVFGDFMGGERWWDFKKITVTTAKQQYWKQCGRDRQCLPNPHSPFLLHKENFDCAGALEGAAANRRGVRRRLWLISDPCRLSRSCWAGLTGRLAKSRHPWLVIFFCPWPFGSFCLEWAHDTGDRTKAITRGRPRLSQRSPIGIPELRSQSLSRLPSHVLFHNKKTSHLFYFWRLYS